MLINTKYGKDDVVSFKLVNGDEIIAKIVEQTDTGFCVDRPCTVIPSQKGIALVQSLFTAKMSKSFVLNNTHVMMHAEVEDDVKNHYLETTTGIARAPAGMII